MNQKVGLPAVRAAEAARNWHMDVDGDGIAWLSIDKYESGTNVLSQEVVLEFDDIVRALAESPPAGLVLCSAKESGFVLGADINEFPQIKTAAEAFDLIRKGHAILERFESLPCTTVAMIDGLDAVPGWIGWIVWMRCLDALHGRTGWIALMEWIKDLCSRTGGLRRVE